MFCTHLPIVVIDTEGQKIPGEMSGTFDRFAQSIYTTAEDGTDYINVSVTIIDNAVGNNHLADAPELTTRSLFRIRGNSSRQFEKKPYLMKFVTEDGLDNDVEVMGMDAHHEWALNGPYLDKTLVRNYLCYNMAGDIMDYAPNVRYCELFVNGAYRGVYLMTETITNGGPEGGRLDLSDTVKGTEVTGYLLRIDRPTEEDLETTRDIYSYMERSDELLEDAAIRYPGKTKLTEDLAHQIEMDFARFEKCLYSYDYDSEDYGYWNWIDVDSFVDYYIINEFTRNVDAGAFSTYIYKEPGGKYKMCVWDFNNAFDLYVSEPYPADVLSQSGRALFNKISMDEDFTQKVIDRYFELRKTWFDEEYLDEYIDSTLEWLGPAVDRNNALWNPAVYRPMSPGERNVLTMDEAVEQVKTWIHERVQWMDENIDALKAVSHPSRHKRYDH